MNCGSCELTLTYALGCGAKLTLKVDISSLNKTTLELADNDELNEGAIVGKCQVGQQNYDLYQSGKLETDALVNLVPKDGSFEFGRPPLFTPHS